MSDFIINYGAFTIAFFSLLVSIGTFVIAWRALQEWKKQKRVSTAEQYAQALHERAKTMQARTCEAIIQDVLSGDYTNDKISALQKSVPQLLYIEQKLLRIEYIFPAVSDDIREFKQALDASAAQVDKIIKQFPHPKSTNKQKQEAIIMQLHDLFTKSVAQQRIDASHQKINLYLSEYIASELKK